MQNTILSVLSMPEYLSKMTYFGMIFLELLKDHFCLVTYSWGNETKIAK
jgi:hypothetical protein